VLYPFYQRLNRSASGKHGKQKKDTPAIVKRFEMIFAGPMIDNIHDHLPTYEKLHNGYLTELDYGRKAFERHRRSPHRVSEPEVALAIGLAPKNRAALVLVRRIVL